jgi:hypothetical protein
MSEKSAKWGAFVAAALPICRAATSNNAGGLGNARLTRSERLVYVE